MPEFIGEVAWPVAILVVALAYRPLLVSVLERNLTRLKLGGLEMAWDQAADVVRLRRPAPLQPSTGASGVAGPGAPPEIRELVEVDPRGAILGMYSTVEQVLRDALREHGIEAEESADALSLVRAGESVGLFPAEVTDAILGIQVLRNLAAHAPTQQHLEPEKAREYIAMAEGSLFAVAMALRRASAEARRGAA